MAKTKKEEPIADNETGSLKVKNKVKKQLDSSETKGNVTKVKGKMKMKSQVIEQTVTKVDLNKPKKPTEENEESTDNKQTEEIQEKVIEETTNKEEVVEQATEKNTETPVLEEITEEESTKVEEIATEAEEAIKENLETGEPLPENIQKLVNFMEETGGDLNDYVKLNQDYSKLDDQNLLHEYYKQTKPHLNNEEINFLMEDTFSYDEDMDDERDIRRKKLALKEQVANAKSHLDGQKSKYYNEIKAGSKLTQEQQKAIDFFNRYNKESEANNKASEKSRSIFRDKTEKVFNDKFKGFEYNVGDKSYRFNIKDMNEVKNSQSNINDFVGKFLDKNNEMSDAKGFHKAMFTARNADAIAKHFYEQGQSDAMKNSIAKAKNIDMNPRQGHETIDAGGVKVRVLGDDHSDFKFKINKNK
jgi:hypothetical protein